MGRKLDFDRVVENLRKGRYSGKIVSADYANTGVRLFEERKFADNLGVSVDFLKEIGVLVIKDFSGWNLIAEPDSALLLSKRHLIDKEPQP